MPNYKRLYLEKKLPIWMLFIIPVFCGMLLCFIIYLFIIAFFFLVYLFGSNLIEAQKISYTLFQGILCSHFILFLTITFSLFFGWTSHESITSSLPADESLRQYQDGKHDDWGSVCIASPRWPCLNGLYLFRDNQAIGYLPTLTPTLTTEIKLAPGVHHLHLGSAFKKLGVGNHSSSIKIEVKPKEQLNLSLKYLYTKIIRFSLILIACYVGLCALGLAEAPTLLVLVVMLYLICFILDKSPTLILIPDLQVKAQTPQQPTDQ